MCGCDGQSDRVLAFQLGKKAHVDGVQARARLLNSPAFNLSLELQKRRNALNFLVKTNPNQGFLIPADLFALWNLVRTSLPEFRK